MEQTKRQVIENLDVVVSEGERLTKLIDDVLDLAKIEAGKFTWNMASVSIDGCDGARDCGDSSLFEAKKLGWFAISNRSLPDARAIRID